MILLNSIEGFRERSLPMYQIIIIGLFAISSLWNVLLDLPLSEELSLNQDIVHLVSLSASSGVQKALHVF